LILYLDTSALVKLYAEEPGREAVENAIREARVAAVSEIGYVEARSALARKEREGSFSTAEHDEAVAQLQQDYGEVYLSRPITGDLIARAGGLARKHALRAYDAVHMTTALVLREESLDLMEASQEAGSSSRQEGAELQVAFMTFDRSLTKAANSEGLAHPHQHSREEQ